MKILVALDGSRPSQHALDEVMRLLPGVLRRSEVVLVDVLPRVSPLELIDTGFPPQALESALIEEETIEADTSLHRAQRELARAGITARLLERVDEPAHGILAIAREVQPDLIVLGTHGRGPLMRLLAGSVSEAVIHHWPGPVLVVHQDAEP